ncbi:MAG: hypothetical protein E7263_00735 [Lachnospiraceae bacterium]|nr:hypothetical protein [Lachnospiraceae bacterium]
MSYVVYADVLLIWIFIINYTTYHLTCRILNHKISQGKLLLWCILSSITLELFYIFGVLRAKNIQPILYISLYIFLMYIFLRFVLKLKAITSFLQLLIYNILGTLLLSGAIQIFVSNNISLIIILPMILIIFLIVPIILKVLPNLRNENKNTISVTLSTVNHTIQTTGYIDTGNTLMDIYSGKPVIILDYSLLQPIISASEFELICEYIKTGNYSYISNIILDGEKIYPIPYKTISNNNAIMPAFKLQYLIINNNIYKNIVAGISHTSFSNTTECKVLLNNNL